MMITSPYLTFSGNCEEAIQFYQKILGGTDIQIMRFSDVPPEEGLPPMPEESKNLIMHAEMRVGETYYYFSDTFPGMSYTKGGDTLSLALGKIDVATAGSIYNQLLDGGIAKMPLQETFWSPAYGYVTDKFGVTWQIIAEK